MKIVLLVGINGLSKVKMGICKIHGYLPKIQWIAPLGFLIFSPLIVIHRLNKRDQKHSNAPKHDCWKAMKIVLLVGINGLSKVKMR